MIGPIEIDPNYSTKRRVIKADPAQMAAVVKQSNKPEDKFETVLFLPEGEGRKGEGGLRTRGYFKQTQDDKPLITVVTVVYNGDKFLEETILSVINQIYDKVEYIIIDGGSTDGTLDIIRKYEHAIDYWVSEKDKGIYDAMNKAIYISNGCWINFMNAGDRFVDSNILSEIKSKLNNCDVVYGATYLNKNNSFRLIVPRKINHIKYGRLPFVHQSALVNKRTLRDIHFSNKYRVNSDLDLFLRIYLEGARFEQTENVIAIYDGYGFSSIHRKIGHLEKLAILKENRIPCTGYRIRHYIAHIRGFLKIIICPVIRVFNIKRFKTYC